MKITENYRTERIGVVWYIFRNCHQGIKSIVDRIAECESENDAMLIVNALNTYDKSKIICPAEDGDI